MGKKSRSKIEHNVEAPETTKIDRSPKVYQKDKLKHPLHIAERDDFTDKQKQLIDLILDKKTKVVFIQGCAGTSKTFTAIYAGLKLMNSKHMSDLVYVRSIIESASRSLGSLPGDSNEKMNPFLMPFHEKLDELLPAADINLLSKEERIQGIPINYLRGASMNAKYVIIDESQNLSYSELTTAITRIGKYSKFIFLGDPGQSDLFHDKSGFMKMYDQFNTEAARENGIHCFAFSREDIVRSGILKFIVETIEGVYVPPAKSEPMFAT